MGIFSKLKQSLTKTKESISEKFDNVIKVFKKVDEELFEELEEQLIMADVGVNTSMEITERLREAAKEKKIVDSYALKGELNSIMRDILTEGTDCKIHLEGKPAVIMVIGVNGVGKTTSIGKIANMYAKQGKKVIVAAADTFRAAAIEQLEIWAQRAGVDIIKHQDGSDPASVIFDAVNAAKARGADLVLCDTAGRLHNKKNLMDELSKISRIIDKGLPGCSKEVLLVLDATTGQNAVNQAREFKEAAGLTGIVLTKLDGTAKGGVVLAIHRDLGLPVKFIGVGEQVDDLQPFDPDAFADALFDVQREEAPVIKEDRAAWEEERREEERLLEEQARAEAEAAAVEEQPEPWEAEPAPVEEAPQEEPQPEKKKRRFWPFGRKRDEE